VRVHRRAGNAWPSRGHPAFETDLRANLDAADEVSENIKRSIDGFIAKREVEALAEAPYMPVWQPAGETAALHDRDALANLATTHCELGDWLA
jgi:putative flavoprotein involved in K+ transport